MPYKIIFAILNLVAILFIPFKVYILVGIIAAIGLVYLDMPRVRKIIERSGTQDFPIGLYICFQIVLDAASWIYSLLNFSRLVFSGAWEKETNGSK